MGTRSSQYVDNLVAIVDRIDVLTPSDVARCLALYVKVYNANNGVVNNVSPSYISTYSEKTMYRRFKSQFNQMYEMFLRNGLDEDDRRSVFKRVAKRIGKMPTNKASMQHMFRTVIEETQMVKKVKAVRTARANLVSRFKDAVTKYLHLTWELGFNVPSQCAKWLISSHKMDKYVMSGDFQVILLPFLPEIAERLKSSYERYCMTDAWEMLKGRYFDHAGEYANLATEIKSEFNKSIPNFSDYFDSIYTNTYRNMMLKKENHRKESD